MSVEQEVLNSIAVLDPELEELLRGLEGHPDDDSGTPVALIELARRTGHLVLRQSVETDEVLHDFPFGHVPARLTGFSRFVRLRTGAYALVRSPA